jgi:hypothetical protein
VALLDVARQRDRGAITGRTISWTAPADQMPLTWEMAKDAIADVEPLPAYE